MNMLEDLEEVVPGELDKSAPAVIWLQIDTTGDNDDRSEPWPGTDGVTWQDESIGGQEIQYVRADLYRDMAARLEAAERDNEKNIAYLKEHVPCTCSYSGSCGQRVDGAYYGESKITWKCQRCLYLEAMQETGR